MSKFSFGFCLKSLPQTELCCRNYRVFAYRAFAGPFSVSEIIGLIVLLMYGVEERHLENVDLW